MDTSLLFFQTFIVLKSNRRDQKETRGAPPRRSDEQLPVITPPFLLLEFSTPVYEHSS